MPLEMLNLPIESWKGGSISSYMRYLTPSLKPEYMKIVKPLKESEIYYMAYNNVWLNLVNITSEEQKTHWNSLASSAPAIHTTYGKPFFLEMLNHYSKKNTEVWVAFASTLQIDHPQKVEEDKVVMYMSVTTSKNIPFVVHMGIQRIMEGYPDLAISLHTMAARVMFKIGPEKKYMMTPPAEYMGYLLRTEVAKKGLTDEISIYNVGKVEGNPLSFEEIENYAPRTSGHLKILEARKNLILTLLEQEKKINAEEAVPFLEVEDDNYADKAEEDIYFIRMYDHKNGQLIYQHDPRNEETVWCFSGVMEDGITERWRPMTGITLSTLARLSDQVANGELMHKIVPLDTEEIEKVNSVSSEILYNESETIGIGNVGEVVETSEIL